MSTPTTTTPDESGAAAGSVLELPLFAWRNVQKWYWHLYGRYAVTTQDGWPRELARTKTTVRHFVDTVEAVDEAHALNLLASEYGVPDPITHKTPEGIHWMRFGRGDKVEPPKTTKRRKQNDQRQATASTKP